MALPVLVSVRHDGAQGAGLRREASPGCPRRRYCESLARMRWAWIWTRSCGRPTAKDAPQPTQTGGPEGPSGVGRLHRHVHTRFTISADVSLKRRGEVHAHDWAIIRATTMFSKRPHSCSSWQHHTFLGSDQPACQFAKPAAQSYGKGAGGGGGQPLPP